MKTIIDKLWPKSSMDTSHQFNCMHSSNLDFVLTTVLKQFVKVVNNLQLASDAGSVSVLVLLVLSVAFDTVQSSNYL